MRLKSVRRKRNREITSSMAGKREKEDTKSISREGIQEVGGYRGGRGGINRKQEKTSKTVLKQA